MRDVKPGVTGLAQISLGYSGNVLSEGTDDASLFADFSNPFGLDDADGADADDMRMKLLYDMAYVAALEAYGYIPPDGAFYYGENAIGNAARNWALKNIAHVILSLGVGGQERVVLDLVDAQRKDGYNVHVVVSLRKR